MSDKKIKHFVIVRFFERKIEGYVHDIFDVNFVSKCVLLARNNLLRSLENQTNRNFEIIFLVNNKYLSEEKYKVIFAELTDGSTVPLKFMRSAAMRQSVQEAYDNYDFVIQSRMDYDDFVYKDAVADTQRKVIECENILIYGYNKGYVYFNGELYPFYDLYERNGLGHSAVFESLILKSAFAKTLPYVNILTLLSHQRMRVRIKEFLEKNGLEFSENMFQYNDTANALIFFRHDITSSNKGNPYTQTHVPPRVKGKKPLTTADITKKQLEEEFGFFHELKSIE